MDERVKRLKPVVEAQVTPQCEVPLDSMGYAKHYKDDRAKLFEKRGLRTDLCMFRSTYRIEGKFYCTVHARRRALEILCSD